MYNVREMGWMLKSMSIYQRDSKGIVKSNFVTSCLAFWGSIPPSSIDNNYNMLLLFTFLIYCFRSIYLMDMTFYFEHLGALEIVASSKGKNSILFHMVIFKSHLASNNAQAYINEPCLGWYTSKSFQINVPNNF